MGLTQQGLASKLKVSRNTVARWERDEMAIPGFLHLALKTLECESTKGSKSPGKSG
jgi:transcriptional regulator with XRE-family HTH domain